MRSLIQTRRAEAPLSSNPFTFMRRLTEEMDRAFGIEPRFFGPAATETAAWAPAIEVFERDNKFFVRAELPGLTREEVKVTVVPDGLTIEGERKMEKEEKKEGFYRTERSYGSFYRQIALPEHVNAEGAKASFKNGVLEVEIPAVPMPEVKARALEIQG
jgi:HSP20 family protein